MESKLTKQEKINYIKNKFGTSFLKYPELKSNFHINRFLVARDYNLKKSCLMIQNLFEYREKRNWEQILKKDYRDFYEKNKDILNNEFYNVSKNFNPIEIYYPRADNLKTILKTYNDEFLENYFLQKKERLVRIILPVCSEMKNKYEKKIMLKGKNSINQSDEKNKMISLDKNEKKINYKKDRVPKLIIIFDMKELPFTSFFNSKVKKFLKLIIKNAQDFYPDLARKIFIINIPKTFVILYFFIKGFLNKATREKIVISSGSCQKEIFELIEKDKLPKRLGGTCEKKLIDAPGPWNQLMKEAKEKKICFMNNNLEKKYLMD